LVEFESTESGSLTVGFYTISFNPEAISIGWFGVVGCTLMNSSWGDNWEWNVLCSKTDWRVWCKGEGDWPANPSGPCESPDWG
jgi:hypothetical protein